MNTYNNNNSNRENMNAANMAASNNQQNAAQKIDDFGQKIGGARKDLYQAAREWAEKLADITAEALTKAGGVSKLVHLPNLESMTAAGAITADQARAALIIWRGIERKPQGSYRADRWAERTRARLEAAAAIITGTEPQGEDVADIIKAARESAEFAVISAAQWPAEPFTFGIYTVSFSLYSEPRKLRIIGGRYYRGEASTDPADIARQLREMTAADAEKQAESRARGPRLGVYHTSDHTRYFIAVENKSEIVLKVCDTYQEAAEAVKSERAELLARYEELRNFPALRRSWNRPRVGKVWHAEDVTPEQFAAVLPFKGVEFGNWLNQQERAALLNSAFDGFHDLADLLGIPAEAVALGGRLNFSFATRGHAGSAAHFETAYNTINLNKRNGAGCMAHEWLHACDHYAAVLAGRGAACSWGSAFATEYTGEPTTDADRAAAELVAVIRSMNYYTRSQNYQAITGKNQGGADYYTQPCELAARGFEGVMLYLLTKAGACSDFLVNLEDWKTFEMNDSGHRRDCYPYPSDAEAAALLPYYMAFFRALFGRCEVSKEAAEGVAAATLQAEQEKQEADRAAAEKAEQERKESEARREAQRQEWARKAAERQAEQERQAAEVKAKAEATRAAIVERLTAAHFDSIATDCDAAAVYFAAHLYGEIYTGKAEIKSDPAEIAATVQAAPVACVQYKYIHNAKRIICRRWQGASIRSNKRTARELVESLQAGEVRQIVRTFADFEKAETWQKAAKLWADTERLHEEQARRHQEAAERDAVSEPTESKPAEGEAVSVAGNGPEGLQLVTIPGGVAVVGTADTEKARGRQTYRARREIKAHGAQWNHAANQWQATDPDSVARLREWFGVSETPAETVSESESEGTAPAVAPTLEQGGEITAAERLGEAVREWAANDYAATHHGATLTDWDKQHPAPAEWCKPGQVFKMNREIAGREVYAIVTKLGGDCFFYVGNFGNNNEHLSAYNCQRWENLQPVEVLHEDAPKFAAMFAKFHSIREAWEAEGEKIWKEREDKERAAAVAPTLESLQDITDSQNDAPAVVLPEWLKVGARVRTRGGYMISARTMRREWVEGHEMTVKEINAERVELEERDARGLIIANQGIALECAAAELSPVCYSESEKLEDEPAAIAASIDTNEAPAETISTPTRAKAYTYQDQPQADTLPEDLPAELLKFYEVNRDASDENPAPVCLFYESGVKKYQAFGSDAHLLANEFGAAVITFTQETEYKHGKKFPHPIDFADFPAAELSARLQWLNREGYAVAVFAAADCLPTLSPAAPNWQERDKARRDRRYSETLELGDGVTRVMESERNMYDFHYDLYYRYYKGGDLLAMFHATGYPEKWDYIGTIRPPHAGRFSNGQMVEHFATIWQAERYMLAEIAKGLQPYNTPTDPTPDPSGEGVGVCHSYETGAPCYSTSEKSEPTADPLADIISEARKQESRTVSGLNYGPIKYLRNNVLYANNGRTTAENMKEYEANLHRVTDPDTYAAYLLSSYDVFVDETQVYCDLRRVFPSLTFQELCKLINDHMGENQQGNGIAAALVPDCVILASSDEYTREKFRERHEKFYKLSSYWKGEEVNTNRESDLKKHYDRESLAVHFLLSEELYYTWGEDRAARCLDNVREIHPDMTAQELREIFDKYRRPVSDLYE